MDLSNLWYGARDEGGRRGEEVLAVRLMAEPLVHLLAGGRQVESAWIVANDDVPAVVTDHFARVGTVIRRESGKNTGQEQANDETLQVRMYETMFSRPPAVMVLGTGDGAGWMQRRGFLVAIDSAKRLGWAVEGVAWSATANRTMAGWFEQVGGAFVDLDDYYESVTFIERGRRVRPTSLTHRPFARVDPEHAVDLPSTAVRA
ncbi:MAG: hypothetical protein U0667_05275 [Chloroflexota bacterium]